MPSPHPVAFLVDVDNTLLDNDHIAANLKRHLEHAVGPEQQARYWTIFEELRAELGYADYLGALQRYRVEQPRDPRVLTVSAFMVNYPFANRLYPNSLDVVEHGHVLIYIHKEQELDDVVRRYPADHYVLVDDKLRILTAVKRAWGGRVTSVFPRQGHYAHDPKALATYPPADVSVERIGDLLTYDLPALLAAASPAMSPGRTRR